ncbi:hypothetical protein Zmor_000156 [Zophobas morio]|uniref:Spaetzle domain-containing protein n=1 Tax=Zophobas morio TaxID=2755281 RepID=A0AA38J260_9CUCU|nr:hypothetical protein Zmor_000156 [Zophobas morio]
MRVPIPPKFLRVLGFAAVVPLVACNEHFNHTVFDLPRIRRSPRKHHHLHESWYDPNIPLRFPGKFLNQRDNQMLLRQESRNGSGVDCCPSVLEMIEPEGGKNQDDEYVELYRDGDYRQRFYELSCHADILGKPCRFMDKKLHNSSKCVQKYSYTYALVKDPGRRHHQRPKNFPSFPAAGPGGTTWTLDYIRVRSGCGCVVTPNKKKRDKQKHHKKAKLGDSTN